MLYALVALACVLIYLFLLKPYRYFSDRGINYDKPTLLFGSFLQNTLQKLSFQELVRNLYEKHRGERYFGFFSFMKPILMIRDLDLIKQIGIKDFDAFTDHQSFTTEELDPLWSKNLFASTGDKWRHLRPTLSPSFTSSKMRLMFDLISQCAQQYTDFYLSQNKEVVSIEMKDSFTRFTNDVIATCAFGLQCDSLREPDNEFYLKGKEATDFSGFKTFKFLLYQISPRLVKLLKIRIFNESTSSFFRKIVKDTIKHREDNNIIRHDMIHLLMEARHEKLEIDNGKSKIEAKPKLSYEDITAQALIFFFAGFDTASTLMTFIAYELAVNPDVQQTLRNEIEETLLACNGKLSYEALMKMKYMDQVVSETLRKWSPTVATDRVCNRNYVIEPKLPGEKPITIEKGSVIWFPIHAIHRDPDIYPNPNKFDPERFNDANKDRINPAAYLSFGIGPRNCIGSRFALMENKAIFFYMLNKFKIVPVAKSVIPVVLSKKHFNTHAEGGMWLGLKRK